MTQLEFDKFAKTSTRMRYQYGSYTIAQRTRDEYYQLVGKPIKPFSMFDIRLKSMELHDQYMDELHLLRDEDPKEYFDFLENKYKLLKRDLKIIEKTMG